MTDELTKAWAAGIFDGEGAALIESTGTTRYPAYQIVVSVASMNQDVTIPIKEVWGGHWCNDQDRFIKLGLSKRKDFSLYFSRVEAKGFFTDIFPYLRSKQDDVLIVLKALYAILDENELRAVGKSRSPRGTSLAIGPYYKELQELRASRIHSQGIIVIR